jgi:hypothetical protein
MEPSNAEGYARLREIYLLKDVAEVEEAHVLR